MNAYTLQRVADLLQTGSRLARLSGQFAAPSGAWRRACAGYEYWENGSFRVFVKPVVIPGRSYRALRALPYRKSFATALKGGAL